MLEVLLRLRTLATIDQIADRAYYGRSMVDAAIRALEAAGILRADRVGSTCTISFIVPEQPISIPPWVAYQDWEG